MVNSGMLVALGRRLFGEIDTYGFNEIVRMYCSYPYALPLAANIYHGWYIHPPRISDLNSSKSTLLVFNKRQRVEWEEKSGKPAYILGAPFVHYRRLMNIQQCADASGTIFYPGHDATSNDFVFDQRAVCEGLAALDEKYKPITVSVHVMDIENGKDKMYREYGFNVFCPGKRRDVDFVGNVYGALSRHKYSCGNHIGTNILYAVEMGIPFFFIGDLGHGVDRKSGQSFVYKRTEQQLALIDKILELFAEPVDQVTEEQKKLIISECGVEECLSPGELRRVLLNSFFKKDILGMFSRVSRRCARRLLHIDSTLAGRK